MLQLLKIVNTGKIIALDSDTGEISDVEVVTGFIPGLIAEKKQEAVTKRPIQEKSVIKPKKETKISEIKNNEKTEQRWSRKFDRCQGCSTTDRKHAGNGLCVNCRDRLKHENKKQKASETYKYKCVRCDREWKFTEPVDVYDKACPKENCLGRLVQI